MLRLGPTIWKQIFFSDETTINPFHPKANKRQKTVDFLNKLKEHYQNRSNNRTGTSVEKFKWNFHGCFNWYLGILPGTIFDGNNNGERYLEVLEGLIPEIDQQWIDEGLSGKKKYWMEDNAPQHRNCKKVKEWQDENMDDDWEILNWPAYSPDLNPIENLWNLMKQFIQRTVGIDKDEFYVAIVDWWDEEAIKQVENYVETWGNRLKQCIERGGEDTDQ